jgi:hypothetical protein
LYDELGSAEREVGDVAVINDDSAWCLSAHRDGRVVFGQLSDRQSDLHILAVPKEKVIAMWEKLIAGDIEGLLKEAWKPGHGP